MYYIKNHPNTMSSMNPIRIYLTITSILDFLTL